MDFGHYTPNLPLPLGIKAAMDTEGMKVWLKESYVNWFIAGVVEFWIVDALIWFPYYGFPGGIEVYVPSIIVGTIFAGIWAGILGLWIGKALGKTGVIEVVEAPTQPKT
jgi:hypothetical protein